MSKAFGSQVDFQKIPVLNLVMQQAASASPPTSPVNGQLWYDTTNNKAKVYENGAWQDIFSTAPAGGDLTGTYPNPQIAPGVITLTDLAATAADQAAATASLRSLGTSSTQAAAGNDARFTDARTPTGTAGGDLTGSTYPNPVVANGAITSAKIADGTLTEVDVSSANKDGVAATPSLRTLGLGAQQALAGTTRLDQIAVPTGSVSMNNQWITNVLSPVNPNDAVPKVYADNIVQGLDAKPSVRAASTVNLTLSGTQTIDGVAVVIADRVLVKDQTTTANNGIYQVASGAWSRVTDMDSWSEVPSAFTFVEQGTVNLDTGWLSIADQGGTLGTTSIAWTQFSAAGQITAGAGLTKTGNSVDLVAGDTTLTVAADDVRVNTAVIATVASLASYALSARTLTAGGGLTGGGDLSANRTVDLVATDSTLTVAADSVGVNTAVVATRAYADAAATARTGKFASTLGALVAGSETTITHSLNTLDVVAAFRTVSNNRDLLMDWRVIDVNSIGVTADVAYSASAVRGVVVG
jgi:hypothetical protein